MLFDECIMFSGLVLLFVLSELRNCKHVPTFILHYYIWSLFISCCRCQW